VTPGAILACRDARAVHWQLGPLPPDQGRLTLVAWTSTAAPVDGGVPPDVADVLARSWTSIARVTFPASNVSARGVVGRTLARLRGSPANAALVSTREPEVAAQVFEDAGFPWWLQGEAVLLSDPDADPLDVDQPTLLALFEDDWASRAARLVPLGVQAVVRPGVDGDVAGVLALNDRFDALLLESLEREARHAGMTWSIVPEAALSEAPKPPVR
jgi:hypothetical protein